MYLLSTARTTVLSDFENLELKSLYQHANGETTDFQFYAQQRIFLEVNKKSGLEIMRIKEKLDHKPEIQRVRKLNIENVYCVACAKQSLEEMAFGGVNGQVSLYNYKNSQFVYRFKAENNRNSVLYLDYNGTDEYISSVFESGQISIYGTKTKAKVDTINIDGNSTLSRFHPTKRFQLSIASFKGAVTVYDIQSKRRIFNSSDAHKSPCRDLCMSAAAPDTLISVGYDCVVNIFDTRRKTQPLQLSHCHPLSTVALSNCGTYFCVGNLKGELISYDMRQTKMPLATKKVHDCAVTRIGFVPPAAEDVGSGMCSFVSAGNQTVGNNEVAGETRKSVAATRIHRDSFCDFLDFQDNKTDRISSRFVMRRDSFDWETLSRKPNNESHRASLHRMTIASLNSSSNVENSGITNSNNNSLEGKLHCEDFVNTRARSKVAEESKRHLLVPNTAPLRDRSNTSKVGSNLRQIEEEQANQSKIQLDSSCGSDKENPVIELELDGHLHILPGDRNSTPNRVINCTEDKLPKEPADGASATPSMNANVVKQIENLRLEMNNRFQQLESELKFVAETNKWQIFTQAANLWAKQMNNTEDIRDALGVLLQTDPFVNEFLRLKEENELLKAQLQQKLSKK